VPADIFVAHTHVRALEVDVPGEARKDLLAVVRVEHPHQRQHPEGHVPKEHVAKVLNARAFAGAEEQSELEQRSGARRRIRRRQQAKVHCGEVAVSELDPFRWWGGAAARPGTAAPRPPPGKLLRSNRGSSPRS
jgi:hypothetical protein